MIKKKKKNAYYYFILRISNNIYFHIVSEILYRKYLQHNEINIKVWKYKINPSLYKYFDQSKKKLIWLILTARKIIICISSRLRKSVILFAEIHSSLSSSALNSFDDTDQNSLTWFIPPCSSSLFSTPSPWRSRPMPRKTRDISSPQEHVAR